MFQKFFLRISLKSLDSLHRFLDLQSSLISQKEFKANHLAYTEPRWLRESNFCWLSVKIASHEA